MRAAQLVRTGDDGYRIPTPAEDDWERIRNGTSPKPSDAKRLHREILAGFWSPQPTFTLLDVKPFKAGLSIDGREEEKGDLAIHMVLAEEGEDFSALAQELRARSQSERDAIFWAVPLSDAIDHETVELFRSREMESRKGREARTAAETRLIDGGTRPRASPPGANCSASCGQPALRVQPTSGAMTAAPTIERGPTSQRQPLRCSARFSLTSTPDSARRRPSPRRSSAVWMRCSTAVDLQGLPSVFTSLGLLRDEGGKTVFDRDAAPLREVLSEIERGAAEGIEGDRKIDHRALRATGVRVGLRSRPSPGSRSCCELAQSR